MKLDSAIQVLELLKPVAQLLPVANTFLGGVIDLLLVGCNEAKRVKSNKEDSIALTERAALCLAIVIRKTQEEPEWDANTRMTTIHELKDLTKELVDNTKKRAERLWWSRFWYKDKDKEYIGALTRRFDLVIERFGVEAQLLTLSDVGEILDKVNQMQKGQKQMGEVQLRMKTEQEDIRRTQINDQQRALLDRLCPIRTAHHDSEDAPRGCTKNTRVGVLDFAREWATNKLSSESILWLSGLAGTGKTAIMKTLSHQLADLGVLGGSYFISLQSSDSCKPQNVIRTLVYQLAHRHPLLREPICAILQEREQIVHQEMSLQIPTLLSDVFARVLPDIDHPIVIMIDALDECDKKDDVEGGQLLPTLIDMVGQYPTKLKLIVTSRITPTIQAIFDTVDAKQFRLHSVERETVASDIRLFIEAELARISQKRRIHSTSAWYTPEDVTELVTRAGSLFIYAATVIKWIDNMHHLPQDRLRQVLQWRPHSTSTSPHKLIDNLYAQVLASALGSDPEDRDMIGKRIQRLLEVIVVAFQPLTISELVAIVDAKEEIVRLDLEQLSSILVVPEKDSAEHILVYHTSFIDYITDQQRCSSSSLFYVPLWEGHGRLGIRCLGLYYDDRYNKGVESVNNVSKSISRFVYASGSWKQHLNLCPIVSSYITMAIYKIRQTISSSNEQTDLLFDLSYLLDCQSDRIGDMDVLHEKISIDRRLLMLAKDSGLEQDVYVSNLANGLKSLYDRSGNMDHLNEAVKLCRESLDLRLPGHPFRDSSLNNLAYALLSLYECSRSVDILNEAIKLNRESLDLCLPDHPLRYYSLNNLANGLKLLYERSGDMDFLKEAVKLHQEALDLRPSGHPNRNTSLNDLANGLKFLYGCSGDTELLNEAIKLHRESLDLCPPGHPTRDNPLDDLGNGLQSLYRRSGDMEPLNEAIKLHREALALRPPGHPYRDKSVKNLTDALKSLHKHNGDAELLKEVNSLIERN